MEGDLYINGKAPDNRRKSDEPWWVSRDPSPSDPSELPFSQTPRTNWSRRAWEARRTPTEQVRATIWTKGEEKVITLQWMVFGEDGDWHPSNIPPGPADLD